MRPTLSAVAAAAVAAATFSGSTMTIAESVGDGDVDGGLVGLARLRVDVTSGPTECDPFDRVSAGRFVRLHYSGTIVDVDVVAPSSSSSSSSSSTEEDASSSSSAEDTDAIGRIFESTREPVRVAGGEDPSSAQEPAPIIEPIAFRIGVGSMIPGWERGLLGLCSGANATLVVPPDMAYGDVGLRDDDAGGGDSAVGGGGVPPGATLRFDVEILSVDDDPPPPRDGDGSATTSGGDEQRHEEEDVGGGGGEPNVFAELDVDGDGKLNAEEVATFFRTMGMDEVPPELWENEDVDKDGYISWYEFGGPKGRAPPTARSASSSSSSSSAVAEDGEVVDTGGGEGQDGDDEEQPPRREEFDAIDTDGDGLLSAREIERFFFEQQQNGRDTDDGTGGGGVPPNFWAEHDADGSGDISPGEFGLPLEKKEEEEEEITTIDDEDDPNMMDPETMMDPERQFETIDADGDGRLSKEEVEAFFREHGDGDGNGDGDAADGDLDADADADAGGGGVPEGFWDNEDADGDGYVSLEEFLGGAEPSQVDFDDVDVDGDERLSGEEVERFFGEQMGGREVPEGLWRDQDADGDGYLSRVEFGAKNDGGANDGTMQNDEL